MSKVGVLIETEDGKVKETNFGVLSAAWEDGGNELFALLLDGEAEAVKGDLSAYGAHHVVRIKGEGIDLAAGPDLQARALASA